MSIDTRLLKTLLKCITSDLSYPFSICLLFAEVRCIASNIFFLTLSPSVYFSQKLVFFSVQEILKNLIQGLF